MKKEIDTCVNLFFVFIQYGKYFHLYYFENNPICITHTKNHVHFYQRRLRENIVCFRMI